MTDFAVARRTMVENQLRTYDVFDQVLLAAMERVPREAFVDPRQADFAYLDREATARDGKTRMLTPMVLGRMIQALELNVGEKVLDVGGGGYGAAILREMGLAPVALAADADAVRASLATAGYGDVPVIAGSLSGGAASQGPFDAILVHGAADEEPSELLKQLKDDGTLVIVIGRGRDGKARLYRRVGDRFSSARVIDAAAPVLDDFVKTPEFAL